MKHFDFIFTGMGLSTLMTVNEMINSGHFRDKTILLLDSTTEKKNDRTWCFWEENKGKWDKLVHTKWHKIGFANHKKRKVFQLKKYTYKMIESIHFYQKIMSKIANEKNITILQELVVGFEESGDFVVVKTQENSYSCSRLLNSILSKDVVQSDETFPLVQQHFEGWYIKTPEKSFDATTADFMDFSIDQNNQTRFMYVLPKSSTEALIEFTVFSPEVLPNEQYKIELEKYLQQKNITQYQITRYEMGTIPMTGFPFWKANKNNILHIGIAGGWCKASTGYTFQRSSKLAQMACQFLVEKSDFTGFYKTNRFWLYDILLLDILFYKNHVGRRIFSSMFFRGNPELVFKFLDEETSILEDLIVILRCPKRLFILALCNRLRKIFLK